MLCFFVCRPWRRGTALFVLDVCVIAKKMIKKYKAKTVLIGGMMAEVVLRSADLITAPNGKQLLLGVLDPEGLDGILDDEYQRERLPVTSVDDWKKAMQAGEVPPLMFGMRGDRWGRQGDKWVLHDPTYVIDGLQRLTAARQLAVTEGIPPFLFVVVRLGTGKRYERELFLRLNSTQRRVGPNVLLRNVREREAAVAVLYSYSETFEASPLYKRVTWAQNGRKSDLMTAVMLLRVAGAVHAHFGPTQATQVAPLLGGLDRVLERVGAETFGENLMTLFEVMDGAWGLRKLKNKRNALHMRLGWMLSVSRIFAEHSTFWRNDRLVVPKWARDKLYSFKVTEPLMIQSIGTVGRASDSLITSLVGHLNKQRPPESQLLRWPLA
jgi:hypothetical protein